MVSDVSYHRIYDGGYDLLLCIDEWKYQIQLDLQTGMCKHDQFDRSGGSLWTQGEAR